MQQIKIACPVCREFVDEIPRRINMGRHFRRTCKAGHALNLVTNEARTLIESAYHITSMNPFVQVLCEGPIVYRHKGIRLTHDDSPVGSVVRDFEKELVLGFRGELRKVNSLLRPEERNTGTACRVAAAALFRELKPQSERGQEILYQHLSKRVAGIVYPEQEALSA